MSTSLYLKCLSHEVPLSSDDLGTKRTESLTEVRKVILDREKWIEVLAVAGPFMTFDTWNDTTRAIEFVVAHPTCEIGLYDGYGYRYAIDSDSYQPDFDAPISEKEVVHAAGWRNFLAIARCGSDKAKKLHRDDSQAIDCPNCLASLGR